VESRTLERLTGGTKLNAEVKGKIIEYAWKMKKQGYAESTIRERVKLLKVMAEHAPYSSIQNL